MEILSGFGMVIVHGYPCGARQTMLKRCSKSKLRGQALRVVEIQTPDGTLLMGRPGKLPPVALRSGDRQSLQARLRRLSADVAAMNRVRRNWRALGMAISASTLDDWELVSTLRRKVSAGQLDAVFLRERHPASGADLEEFPVSPVLHLQFQGVTVLVAPKGLLLFDFHGHSNPKQAAEIIRKIGDHTPQARAIVHHVHRQSGAAPAATSGGQLRQQIAQQLDAGTHDAVVLTHPTKIAQAAARPDAPKPITAMSQNERIAAALRLSVPYAVEAGGEELRKTLEEMIKPANIAMMIGMAAAIALANLNPISGAVVDTALLALAWWNGGNEAITGLTNFALATLDARDATSDMELDAAARAYGKALGAMGPKLLGAILNRLAKKLGGKAGNNEESGTTAKIAGSETPAKKPGLAPVSGAMQAIAGRQAALLKQGVPLKTLEHLKTDKQLAAFEKALNEIDKLDLSKLKGKDTIFYSGMAHGKPAWQSAARVAKEKKMNWITDASEGVLDKNRSSIPPKAMNFLDIKLSRKMAENASGNIKVIGDPRTMNVETGIFYKEELPRLLDNPNVSAASKAELQQLKQILDAKARALEAAKAANESVPFNSIF
jgi:hypothetical protein